MLCMHGGMGFDQTTLSPWLDPLGDCCELIYYDHRGNGRSDPPADWSALDHAQWVGEAEELRVRLGLGPILLFGHSWGGFLAQEYALRFPDSVAGLVLCATAPVLDYGETILANARGLGTAAQVEALSAAFGQPMADDAELERFIRTIGPFYFLDAGEERAKEVFGRIRFSANAFNRALFHCAPTFDTLAELPALTMPVLLLGGRGDWIMPPAHGIERIARQVRAAEVEIFERSGHFPFVEQPAEFLERVRSWIRRVPGRIDPG
jgi:proline iminopeptidase